MNSLGIKLETELKKLQERSIRHALDEVLLKAQAEHDRAKADAAASDQHEDTLEAAYHDGIAYAWKQVEAFVLGLALRVAKGGGQ